MDLVCANKVKTNFIISARYIAFGIGGASFFAIPDIYGRRNSMLIHLLISTIAQFVIVLVPIYEARLIGNIVCGLCTLKQSVPFSWIFELMPADRKTLASVSISCVDTITLAVICSYFLFIDNHWFPLMMGMTILNTISLIYCFFVMPESPHWLLTKGKVSEAIDAFNTIARFNGVKHRIAYGTEFEEAVDIKKISMKSSKKES